PTPARVTGGDEDRGAPEPTHTNHKAHPPPLNNRHTKRFCQARANIDVTQSKQVTNLLLRLLAMKTNPLGNAQRHGCILELLPQGATAHNVKLEVKSIAGCKSGDSFQKMMNSLAGDEVPDDNQSRRV